MSEPKRRKSGLTTLDLHLLELACQPVWEAFGSGTAGCTYLVGTAQTGGEYRDVDVRTILPDEEFDALFGAEDRNGKALWSLMCAAIGRMLAKQTGLPIDYQIQRMTQANEKYKAERNPIGAGRRYYAGGGDATVFPTPYVTSDPADLYSGCEATPPIGMEDHLCILRGPHHFHQWEVSVSGRAVDP